MKIKISEEHLQGLMRGHTEVARLEAEARVAQATFQLAAAKLGMQTRQVLADYGAGPNDEIDVVTGEVTRKPS